MRYGISLVRMVAVLGLAAMLVLPATAQESESNETGKPPVRVKIVKPGEAARSARRIPVRLVLPGSEGASVASRQPVAGEGGTAGIDDGVDPGAGSVDILIDSSAPATGGVAAGEVTTGAAVSVGARPTSASTDRAAPVAPSLFDQLVAPAWSGGGGFDRAPWPEEPEAAPAREPLPTPARSSARDIVVLPLTSDEEPVIPAPREQGESHFAQVPGTATAPGDAGPVQQAGSLSAVAGDDYRLGPGDRIDVFVWRNADLSRQVPVRPDGRITLPLVGEVMATGKTVAMLREEITARLSDYVQMPTVTVSLAEIRSLVVYVLGDVRNPGAVQMDRNLTVLQAIAAAGGLTEFADRNDIVVMRTSADGVHQRWTFRYDDVVKGNQLETNIVLQAGDTIIVP